MNYALTLNQDLTEYNLRFTSLWINFCAKLLVVLLFLILKTDSLWAYVGTVIIVYFCYETYTKIADTS